MNRKLTIIGLVLASFILVFGSCKPKQSAYKSVYEQAKEKEIEKEADVEVAEDPASVPTYYPATNEPVRKEKVTPVYDHDAGSLQAYNVVIAAMGMKPNAESLKSRMEQAGYKIILVQNEQGLFRVIIGSYTTKEEAVAKKNEILDSFREFGDMSSLRSKYGIPFDDWWILQRDY